MNTLTFSLVVLSIVALAVQAEDACEAACPIGCSMSNALCFDIPNLIDCDAINQNCLDTCKRECGCNAKCSASCAGDREGCLADAESTFEKLQCNAVQQECVSACQGACPEEVAFQQAEEAAAAEVDDDAADE